VRRGTRLGASNGVPGTGEGGRQASVEAGRGEERGNQAGEDPYPKAELWWRLTAIVERCSGDSDGG
jgi:hypothetical protein